MTEHAKPFLSVITRTQGRRPVLLRDVMTALTAQTCEDFEWLVIGHRLCEREQASLDAVLRDGADFLRIRTRVLRVDHGNRTAPLNHALVQARGRYFAVLDDDDVPMGHWVDTFRAMSEGADGQVLRAVAVKQAHEQIAVPGGGLVPCASGLFDKEYPSRFELLEHLRQNQTPLLSLAFPRQVLMERGIWFDENLSTTEDWDFLLRAADACGVASSPAITAIYRWWTEAESSRTAHGQEEWDANYARVLAKQDLRPMHMPPGAARALRDLLNRHDRLLGLAIDLNARLARTGQGVDAPELRTADAGARDELRMLLDSASWRLTTPLRLVRRWLRRLPPNVIDVGAMSSSQVREAIRNIRASSSWRITAPLRRGRGDDASQP